VVVGVNEFIAGDERQGELFQVDARAAEAAAARLERIRRARDADQAARALESVDRAARGSDNLLPHILDAVTRQVTLGEICGALRAVFGVHQPSVLF
jgi:methylmalonyl-CoA mutase N-terminal domain/subunit